MDHSKRIREIAEDEALGFYILFEDESSKYNNYKKFLAYLKKHDELPEGSSIWEPFDYKNADIDEDIESHANYIENILTNFAKEIGTKS